MSNNIWILKCSVLDFHTSKEYKKIDDAFFSSLHLFIEKQAAGTKYCF